MPKRIQHEHAPDADSNANHGDGVNDDPASTPRKLESCRGADPGRRSRDDNGLQAANNLRSEETVTAQIVP